MGKHEKIKQDVLGGTANANIRFDDLCSLMTRMGFKERSRGSHRIYSKAAIPEIINLQPDGNGKAKKYQVGQVRHLIMQHTL